MVDAPTTASAPFFKKIRLVVVILIYLDSTAKTMTLDYHHRCINGAENRANQAKALPLQSLEHLPRRLRRG
jgi:hypothetical protein